VTGASDGIGLAYCKELAKRGFNVILLSRNIEKLKKAEKEVKQVNDKVLTKLIAQDLSEIHTFDKYEKLLKDNFTKDMDVALLFNNAGLSGAGLFSDFSTKEM